MSTSPVDTTQFTSLVARAEEVSARGGSVIATALKTVFERLVRSEIQQELTTQLGVDIASNSPSAIVETLKTRWPHLSPQQRIDIATLLGGVRACTIVRAALS